MNWLNSTAYHLIIFLACLAAFVTLTVTGHDNSELVKGVFYGVLGLSGTNSASSITSFLRGPDAPDVGLSGKQGGFVRLRLLTWLSWAALVSVTAIAAACGTVGAASASTAQQIATACAGGSATVKALTVAKQAGYLSAADDQAIETALTVVKPLCTGTAPPTATDAELATLTGALSTLSALQVKYHATAPGS